MGSKSKSKHNQVLKSKGNAERRANAKKVCRNYESHREHGDDTSDTTSESDSEDDETSSRHLKIGGSNPPHDTENYWYRERHWGNRSHRCRWQRQYRRMRYYSRQLGNLPTWYSFWPDALL